MFVSVLRIVVKLKLIWQPNGPPVHTEAPVVPSLSCPSPLSRFSFCVVLSHLHHCLVIPFFSRRHWSVF